MKAIGKLRILIAKPGLDGHDVGAKIVARTLRDAGMEVIYTGLHQSPDQIVAAAIQESVDVVGLSVLSGAHLGMARKVIDLLRGGGAADVRVVVGGVVPKEDIDELKRMGVAAVFSGGTPLNEIAEKVASLRDVSR